MIQTVKLSKLVLSDINVRRHRIDKAESFAASIAANGILQNLIVTPLKKPRGHFGVVAGESRYRGLMLLAERGEINADDYDVPVKLMTGAQSELSEVSLVENFQRDTMNPADECRGFQLILAQAGDIDALAKRFHVTRRFVEGRLRLANLADPIFEALAEERITLELAKAYGSTGSQERQLMVWKTYGHNAHQSADSIRRIIANDTLRANDPLALLVGAAAYEAAGGVVERDFFIENGERWTNPEIVRSLAAELMEAEAKRIGEERGLAWVRPIASDYTYDAARGLYRVYLPCEPMSEAEAARVDAIETRLGELQEKIEDGGISDDDARTADAEYDTLHEELEALNRRPAIMPEGLAPRIGTFLTLSQSGTMVLDDSWYSETPITVTLVEPDPVEGEDGEDAIDDGDDSNETGERGGSAPTFRIEEGTASSLGRGGSTTPVEPDRAAPGGKPLSQILVDQLAMQRRDVLGAALQANPGLALDYMLFVMVDARNGNSSGDGTTIGAPRPQDPVLANNVPASRARDYLAEVHEGLETSWAVSGDKVARFEAFRVLADDVKAAWLAWVVATSLEAREPYGTVGQNPLQNRLATILEVDVASWWRPTSENFFDRVSKGALLSLLDEVGGSALSGRNASSKKLEISANCQKLFAGDAIVEAEVKQTALAWLPSAMRFNDVATSEADGADDQDELTGLIGDDEPAGEDADLADLIPDGIDDESEADGVDVGGSGAGDVEPAEHDNDDTVNDLVAAE